MPWHFHVVDTALNHGLGRTAWPKRFLDRVGTPSLYTLIVKKLSLNFERD